jgi:hypothetical protein
VTLNELIDHYENGGPLLAYAITSVSRDHELARPGPGVWSIAEDEPTLLAYDENAWLSRLGYDQLPIEEAVSLFVANRRWVARILKSLPEADFSRAGNHTEKGRMTLAELVRGYVGHLDHHLKFLYAKRGNLGIAIYPRYSYALE